MTCRAIILNDTRRVYGHLGCTTVMASIEELCRKHNISIVRSFKDQHIIKSDTFAQYIEQIDLVILNGEGTMHHDREAPANLMQAARYAKSRGKKVYLINSIWQENPVLSKMLNIFDKVYFRDSFSFREARDHTSNLSFVPDLSLYKSEAPESFSLTQKRSSLIVIDSIYRQTSRQLLQLANSFKVPFFAMGHKHVLRNYVYDPVASLKPVRKSLIRNLTLRNLFETDRALTGRFHGMLLCAKLGIPFAVVKSNSHKIEAFLNDIGLTDFPFLLDKSDLTPSKSLYNFIEDMDQYWTEKRINQCTAYVTDIQPQIEGMFAEIATSKNKTEKSQ